MFLFLFFILINMNIIYLFFFQGYSSLAIALVLPESGCLVACERDGRSLEVAKKYYNQAGVSHKVFFFPLLYGLQLLI
jgi:predicted O-methyltransferase YrrM